MKILTTVGILMLLVVLSVTPFVLTACAGIKAPAPRIPDDTALRPYVHFVRLVVEGTPVSPQEADLPIPPEPVSYLVSSQQRLELVFFMEREAYGSVHISERSKRSSVIFTREWHFSEATGKVWSNLMRPPGATFRENRISLGTFKRGVYVLTIVVEDELTTSIDFAVK